MRPSGLRIASNFFTASDNLSLMPWVIELFGTSMSSATITSALEPASCPEIPTDFTEGACEALAGATSKLILDCHWSDFGRRWAKMSISLMSRRVNVVKSSERLLDAETTKMFNWGFM